MAFRKSLRNIANRLFQKAPANDDGRERNPFLFSVTADGKARAMHPPHDNSVIDDLHGHKVADPFRPLENLDAPETVAWADRQNKAFADYISAMTQSVDAAKKFMTDAFNYNSPSMPARYGEIFLRTHRKVQGQQALIEKSVSADGPWETLFDPNPLSADHTTAIAGWTPSEDGKRIALFLSDAGSDMKTLRILDVETGTLLQDRIENCKSAGVLWDKDSHNGFHYNYPLDDGSGKWIVKHHAVGTEAAEDRTIFQPALDRHSSSLWRMRTSRYEWIYTYAGTDPNNGLMFRACGSNGDFEEIQPAGQHRLSPCAELDDGTVLALTTEGAGRKRLVRFDPHDPAPEKWKTVIPEHESDILESAMLHRGKLYAFYTHDTADAVRIHTPEGTFLHDMPLPTQSSAGYARINPDDTTFLMRISGFLSAGDFYTYDTETNALTFKEKGPARTDLNDCIVERVYATSKDGTQVPMTVIRHPDTALDGSAALILYGYGGFNVSLTPSYDPETAHFIRSGGIYVQANLRGGGEFGNDWYNQGRLARKQNVFDDFISCAEKLIEGKYTSKERLVINGASNGGLLTSAVMLQRPDLFGAVITEVAVTDMFRFHLTDAGAAWRSDYGDPSLREDFNAAARYSPLHNVGHDAKYPPHLIKTASHDDRVHPWHSFKLAATLQSKSSPENVTLLRIEQNAGHGAGKPTTKIIQEYAETFAFIEKTVGPVDQNAYKAQKAQKPVARKGILRHIADKFGFK